MSLPGTPQPQPPAMAFPAPPNLEPGHVCLTKWRESTGQPVDNSPGRGIGVVQPVDDSPECTPRPVEPEKDAADRHKDHEIYSDLSVQTGGTHSSRSPCLSIKSKEGLFGGVAALKQSVYENLAQKEYSVYDFYSETGYIQAIAKSEKFSSLTLVVIACNAVWIGISTDHNDAETLTDADPVFQIGEHFFCCFFCFEWLVRFLAFSDKRKCLCDSWFKFDSSLVCLMVLETWIIPIFSGNGNGLGDASMLRLLRLLRLTRMARLMRSVPELVTLLKGMAAATRSVFSTLVLLVLFLYVFAIVFKQQCTDYPKIEAYFSDIPTAMWNLLIYGTFMDNIGIILQNLGQSSYPMTALFLLFVLISAFTILNMLIGVLCEVVSSVSHAESEKVVVTFVKQKLFRMLADADVDETGTISQEEFQKFLVNPEVCAALKELQVDVPNLMALTDVLFAAEDLNDPGASPLGLSASSGRLELSPSGSFAEQLQCPVKPQLAFHELLEKILQLRSTNTSTVTDIVDVRKYIQTCNRKIHGRYDELTTELTLIKHDQKQLLDTVASLAQSVNELLSRSTLSSPQRSHCRPGSKSLRESAGASPIRAPTQSARKTFSASPPRRRRSHKVLLCSSFDPGHQIHNSIT